MGPEAFVMSFGCWSFDSFRIPLGCVWKAFGVPLECFRIPVDAFESCNVFGMPLGYLLDAGALLPLGYPRTAFGMPLWNGSGMPSDTSGCL